MWFDERLLLGSTPGVMARARCEGCGAGVPGPGRCPLCGRPVTAVPAEGHAEEIELERRQEELRALKDELRALRGDAEAV